MKIGLGKYILIQIALLLVSPISSFVVSLRYYKEFVSQIFFVLFSFYFGYYYAFGYDIMNHYEDMEMYFIGRPLGDILNDFRVYIAGFDAYHIVFKYVLSRFDASMQIFGGMAAAIYSIFFVWFMRQFKQFYSGKMPALCTMLFIMMAMFVEFYWYQGLRFWTGAFYFMAIYMKYVNTSKIRYLLLSSLAILFHVNLSVLFLGGIANYLLEYAKPVVRWILLGVSFVYRLLEIDLMPFLRSQLPWLFSNRIEVMEDYIWQNALAHWEKFREEANVVYDNKTGVVCYFLLAYLSYLFLRWKIKLEPHYKRLFYMFMTMFTISNFGYVNWVFYDRMFKASVLLLCAYTFIVTHIYYGRIHKRALILCLIMAIPLLLVVLVPFVQQRAVLFHPELFFGNFFMDWNINLVGYDNLWNSK